MDEMLSKKYWRHNSWCSRPINIFRLKRKRYDGNYKEDEIDCEINEIYLFKLIYLNSICQN